MASFKCVCVKLFFYCDNMEYNKLMYNINYTTCTCYFHGIAAAVMIIKA